MGTTRKGAMYGRAGSVLSFAREPSGKACLSEDGLFDCKEAAFQRNPRQNPPHHEGFGAIGPLFIRRSGMRNFITKNLTQGFFYFDQPVRFFEHFTRFWAVRGSNNTIGFHEIDEMRGAAITNSQPPLQQGS